MSPEMEDFFSKIEEPCRGGFAMLPAGARFQVFTLDSGTFRPFFGYGHADPLFRYSFLESDPDEWAPLFDLGALSISSSHASGPGSDLWMFLDRPENPGIVMILEVPGSLGAPEEFLRLLVQPDLQQLRRDLDLLPTWLARILPSVMRSPSPMLLVSEVGSGRQQVLAFLERYRFRGEVVRFSPGRTAGEVQLREFFGDPVGERLRSSESVPILDQGNTIFIAEASNLAPAMQLRLLSELTRERHFWIFDTSRDLEQMAGAGKFDAALSQKLQENCLVLPPLRQQGELLISEAERYLGRLVKTHRRQIRISDEAINAIRSYEWPGNLQELHETLEAAYFLTRTESIGISDLHFGLWFRTEEDELNLRRRAEDLERKLMLQAHAIHGGNQVHMARALGISRGSLQYRWARLGVQERRGE